MLIAARMPLSSVQHHICCSHWREAITTRLLLHSCPFLSLSHFLYHLCETVSYSLSLYLVALSSLQQPTLELYCDWLEMMSSLPQRCMPLADSADCIRALISHFHSCSAGARHTLAGGSWPLCQGRHIMVEHCKNHTLDTHYNEVLMGVYNRMKGNNALGFVNAAQVCTRMHACK